MRKSPSTSCRSGRSPKGGSRSREDQSRDHDLLVNGVSAFSPEEVRKRVISDPDSPYANADPDDVPDPPDPMEAMGGGKIDLKGNAAFGSGPEAKGEGGGED